MVAPPYDVIGPDERARLVARHPANVVRLDLPGRSVRRRAGRSLPARGPDAGRRGARTAPCARTRIRPCTSTSRPTASRAPRWSAPSAGSSRGCGSRRSGRGAACCPHERTLTGPKEDRYKLLRATGVNTSPVIGLFDDPSGATGARLAGVAAAPADVEVVDDDGVRHRLWAVAGRRRRPVRGDGSCADRRGSAAAGHDRRRPSPLRDRAALPRRAADDPLVRGGSGVRLPADAVPGGERASRSPSCRPTAWSAASAMTGRRALLRAGRGAVRGPSRPSTAGELVRQFDAAGLATRRGGPVRPVDSRRRGAASTARRAAFGSGLPTGGDALRALDVTLLGVALERLAGLDAAAVAGGAIAYTKSAAEAVASRRAQRRHRCRLPAGADPGRRHRGGRPRRRRHAPEIDLLLPQGPDRPPHQPARVVTTR